jgi:hypothetical protein
MRPTILVSQGTTKWLKLLQEFHALVRSVLQLHKNEMQAHLEPSIVPHLLRGENVTVVTNNLFLRGHPNRNLLDR